MCDFSVPLIFLSSVFKGAVCDSGESLLIFELSSQTNTPLLQSSFKLARVTHSISLSCVRARVVTYYTEVFSGNGAKTLVFDILGWWLYLSHFVWLTMRRYSLNLTKSV